MTLPYIFMKTADEQFVPWLASQTDLLAEDWSQVEKALPPGPPDAPYMAGRKVG